MNARSKTEWAIRLTASAAVLVLGWYVGTQVGSRIGDLVDVATHNDFVSWALLTIPVFGLIGSAAGLYVGYRILRRPRSPT